MKINIGYQQTLVLSEREKNWTDTDWKNLPDTWQDIINLCPEILQLYKRFKNDIENNKYNTESRSFNLYLEYRILIENFVGMFAPEDAKLFHPDSMGQTDKRSPYNVVTDKFLDLIGY